MGIGCRACKLPEGKVVLRKGKTIHGPDYSVVFRTPDGRELHVGRIFYNPIAQVGGATPWFWSVEFHHRKGRGEPYDGLCDTEAEAKAAWRKCWGSADVPINWPPRFEN